MMSFIYYDCEKRKPEFNNLKILFMEIIFERVKSFVRSDNY